MKRLLICGFGDIARRVVQRLSADTELRTLSRQFGHDLDRADSLAAFGDWEGAVLHLAPPASRGDRDERTANLLRSFARAPERIVYASTSGVYGDCRGAYVDEQRPPAPLTDRARRRLDAERQLTDWCAGRGVPLVILRVPGIYASDRLPIERLRANIPVLNEADDVFTNHIHADDLGAICLRALQADAPPGVYNASDDSELKMGDWFDLLADRLGLPRAPRINRAQAESPASKIPPASLSFMRESRRLVNRRLKEVLSVRLAYPTVQDGLASLEELHGHIARSDQSSRP